tara:strand:- start:38 stop:724 length:687 start_codon:yes stop_codon:yes gene_type:complete
MDFFSIAGIDPHKLLKTQVNELVVKLKAFEIENTKLKDTVSEFDLKLVYLQQIVNNQEKTISNISKKNETLEEKLLVEGEEHNEEIRIEQKKYEDLKKEFEEISNTFSILNKQSNVYQQQIECLESESNNYTKIIKKLETRIKTLDTQKTRLNNKIHKLLEQVQDHNLDTIKELNTENEKNKDYLSTLIGKVSEIIEKNKKEPKTLSKTVSKRGRKKKEEGEKKIVIN